MLGTAFKCPIFPQNIFNAPYPCITELQSVASLASGGVNLESGFIGAYLQSNFTENCARNCYQTYIVRANSFYGSCSSGLNQEPLNTTYKIANVLSNFKQMRNQSCGEILPLPTTAPIPSLLAVHNAKNQNCYNLATTLAPKEGGAYNIFDMNCVYGGQDNAQILQCK